MRPTRRRAYLLGQHCRRLDDLVCDTETVQSTHSRISMRPAGGGVLFIDREIWPTDEGRWRRLHRPGRVVRLSSALCALARRRTRRL